MHHYVNQQPLQPPFPAESRRIVFGMGCFWGAERRFWQLPGVHVTAVGYAGGTLEQPDYPTVCSGTSGHAEVVLVVYYPDQITISELLHAFWTGHDPTQGMRQGNDIGSQYRSVIQYLDPEQQQAAEASRDRYQQALSHAGYGPITTEITPATPFWYAEAYHQQYLAKNPGGYCGLGGTGVAFPE